MKISDVLAQREAKKKGTAPSTESATAPAAKKALKVLRTRETPNPNALQYTLNAQILDYGKKSYTTAEDAKDDKMGEALFDMPDVVGVYIMENFVTVTKRDEASWNPLSDQVWKIIESNAAYYESEKNETAVDIDISDFPGLSQDKKVQAVEMVLNRSIRSSLARDGGGVDLMGLEGNEVQIHYQGACGDCPSSTTGTLQHIEGLLQQQLHPDLVVKSV